MNASGTKINSSERFETIEALKARLGGGERCLLDPVLIISQKCYSGVVLIGALPSFDEAFWKRLQT